MQALKGRGFCESMEWWSLQAQFDTLLGFLALPDDPAAARLHLSGARSYASRSDHVEIKLRCHHLAAEIARIERAYDLALSELDAGVNSQATANSGIT